MDDLVAYDAYVPHHWLRRAEITAVLGVPRAPRCGDSRAERGRDE